jgi:hypothetical protein
MLKIGIGRIGGILKMTIKRFTRTGQGKPAWTRGATITPEGRIHEAGDLS